jgi:hypothetical protein
MICLFADLSLFSLFAFTRGTRRRLLHRTTESHGISLRGLGARRIYARMLERFCDSLSRLQQQPHSRDLSPRRCQPLVTRIIQVQKFDAPNR